MKKIVKITEYILLLLFAVLLLFEKQKFTILLGIPCMILLYFFYKNNKIKNYPLFLFLTAFAIRIFSLFILKVEIADDFKTMYEASLSILKGNFDFMNGFYFHTYPFQLGLTLYQAFFLKIWNDVLFLKLLNSIITSFIVVYLYKIMRLFVEEKISKVVSLGYLFYFYPLYLNSVLTNQHIPALIMLIIIYYVLNKNKNVLNGILIGLLLGLANFFRTESIILLMGIILYEIIFIKKDTCKKIFIYLIVVICSYFAFTNTTSYLLSISPLKTESSSEYDKNVTYWKFYCGLSVEHNGIYNEDDREVYFNSDDEKKVLINRIENDIWKFPLLFLKKEVILWTQTNYDLRITNLHGLWYTLFLYYNQGFLNIVLILFVLGLIPKKEEEKKEILFIKILLGLYYGIYLFIEISPRYAYNLHMLVFLITGVGVERYLTKGIQKLKSIKQK